MSWRDALLVIALGAALVLASIYAVEAVADAVWWAVNRAAVHQASFGLPDSSTRNVPAI